MRVLFGGQFTLCFDKDVTSIGRYYEKFFLISLYQDYMYDMYWAILDFKYNALRRVKSIMSKSIIYVMVKLGHNTCLELPKCSVFLEI